MVCHLTHSMCGCKTYVVIVCRRRRDFIQQINILCTSQAQGHFEIRCPRKWNLNCILDAFAAVVFLSYCFRARLDVDNRYEFLRLMPSGTLRELVMCGDSSPSSLSPSGASSPSGAVEGKIHFGVDFFRCLANTMPKLRQVPLIASLSATEVRLNI